MASDYGSKDLEVLEGLEPVRERPGMYIGTTGSKGMHHILWEIVDNSIDEISNGYGDTIEIEIFKDNSISVKDNGRGIPVDMHPKYKVPGVYLVFTKLHAGGKFNNKNYGFSGGLHGVGASVTNALSSWLKVEIWRDGKVYSMDFHSIEDKSGKIHSGVINHELTSKPSEDKKAKGTRVTFLPDSRVFKSEEFDYTAICKRAKDLAFLNAGLKISVTDHRQTTESGKSKCKNYCYKGGLSDFVQYLNEGKTIKYQTPIFIEKKQENFYVSLAMQLTDGYSENTFSYVNNIPTSEGGTHEIGFKSALTKALNDFGRQRNIIKEKQENYIGEDFREGLTSVLAIKMQNVQFEGQTKSKLGNPEARTLVENLLTDAIKDYLNNKAKKEVIDAIFEKAAIAQKARLKSAEAKNVARAIKSSTNNLVGKLANCSGKKPEFNELFIVEGDSAGGSAKSGRDPKIQAILPLRGKPLNTEQRRISDIVANEELVSLINALGTGFDKDFNIQNLKFNKVIILADADQDGGHIRSILLTFFFRYMKELITDGHVYIGMPPLYRIQDKNGTRYAYDDVELKEMLKTAARGYSLNRYKGLGEMNPEQLWETTMNPKKRALMRVTIEDAAEADHLFTTLMGKDAAPRRDYIYEYANFNKQDQFKELVEKKV
ncbi:MAG: DNA gyrase subunit B [Christensenella sp.]|nr:DNA gyrase subunit B [Christensenella sp.]